MSNIGFYPTTQLNPYTTTIGSGGTFQSIMSYIYGASLYETINTASASSVAGNIQYTGLNLKFTPVNSQNALLKYDIYSGNGLATTGIYMDLYFDSNPPPGSGSSPPGTAIEIDSGELALGVYRSQTLVLTGGKVYGGNNSGASYTLALNTPYYLTWYMYSAAAPSVGNLVIYGMSIQSI